jgi:hypothetical protein
MRSVGSDDLEIRMGERGLLTWNMQRSRCNQGIINKGRHQRNRIQNRMRDAVEKRRG